jgi:hypothetical protein
MTASIREQILSSLAATLASTTGVVAVYRSRAEAFSRAEAPSLIISPGPGRCQRHSTCKLHWTMDVQVVVHCRGNTPDVLADPIISSAHALIMADTTIGGLAVDIVPTNDDPQIDQADMNSIWWVHTYEVQFRTREADLTQP